MDVPDEDLAKAAAAGDQQAFCILMERSYDRIFALSFRLTGRRAEAEDLTQDICTKLPLKITSYKARAKFSTWLYRVIVNAAHDQRRRLARQETLSLGWGNWELARQAENQTAAADSDWLVSAIQSLSTELRDTLALVLDDVSHKDAAQILRVSLGTISWRVADAKALLRG